MINKRLCILYHYYEANSAYRTNLQHFLTFGTHVDADIYCMIAGNCSIELPSLDRLRYIYTENKNWDYGGYAIALNEYIDISAYDYFAFINSSVRGPFIPPNFTSSWVDQFLKYFSADVGIVGCAINILPGASIDAHYFAKHYREHYPPYAHVQSTAYLLSAPAISVLVNNNFYGISCSMSKADIVCHYEIRMSQLLIKNGLNLKCLLPEYNLIDYRRIYSDPNPTSYQGDPSTPDGYFGRSIHPYEGVFIKTQRELYPDYYLDLLTQSMLVEKSSRRIYQQQPNMT